MQVSQDLRGLDLGTIKQRIGITCLCIVTKLKGEPITGDVQIISNHIPKEVSTILTCLLFIFY